MAWLIGSKYKIGPLTNVNALFKGNSGSILAIISDDVHPPTLVPIGSQAPPHHVIFFIRLRGRVDHPHLRNPAISLVFSLFSYGKNIPVDF